jgi:hypothetical protein
MSDPPRPWFGSWPDGNHCHRGPLVKWYTTHKSVYLSDTLPLFTKQGCNQIEQPSGNGANNMMCYISLVLDPCSCLQLTRLVPWHRLGTSLLGQEGERGKSTAFVSLFCLTNHTHLLCTGNQFVNARNIMQPVCCELCMKTKIKHVRI